MTLSNAEALIFVAGRGRAALFPALVVAEFEAALFARVVADLLFEPADAALLLCMQPMARGKRKGGTNSNPPGGFEH